MYKTVNRTPHQLPQLDVNADAVQGRGTSALPSKTSQRQEKPLYLPTHGMRTLTFSVLPSNMMKMMATLHNQMTSLHEWMERTKIIQSMRTMIQNKVTARIQKIRKTMTVTRTMMMKMTLKKHKCWKMTSTSTNKLRQSQEWIRISEEWTAPREKSQGRPVLLHMVESRCIS